MSVADHRQQCGGGGWADAARPQDRLDERLLERVSHLAVGLVVDDHDQRVVRVQHRRRQIVADRVGV